VRSTDSVTVQLARREVRPEWRRQGRGRWREGCAAVIEPAGDGCAYVVPTEERERGPNREDREAYEFGVWDDDVTESDVDLERDPRCAASGASQHEEP